MQGRLSFLCAALLLNEIYVPLKFQVDTLTLCEIMLRTKSMRNKQEHLWAEHYMPESVFLSLVSMKHM
jgi:hypothetical protein